MHAQPDPVMPDQLDQSGSTATEGIHRAVEWVHDPIIRRCQYNQGRRVAAVQVRWPNCSGHTAPSAELCGVQKILAGVLARLLLTQTRSSWADAERLRRVESSRPSRGPPTARMRP